jgi:hypothetical protein
MSVNAGFFHLSLNQLAEDVVNNSNIISNSISTNTELNQVLLDFSNSDNLNLIVHVLINNKPVENKRVQIRCQPSERHTLIVELFEELLALGHSPSTFQTASDRLKLVIIKCRLYESRLETT